jgi:TolB protein
MNQFCFLAACFLASSTIAGEIGFFSEHQDIGETAKRGEAKFDAHTKTYRISGGGENMWFAKDDFHFVYSEMKGDCSIAADIQFPTSGGNAHKKAVLMFRQTLDTDSPFIDVAVHGEGLTSLQFRETKGGLTREVQTGASKPTRVQLIKRGDEIVLLLAKTGNELQCTGASYRLKLSEPFYIGLGVCAHDNKALEEAVFSKVDLKQLTSAPDQKPAIHSTIEIVPIGSKDRRVSYHTSSHLEAPNWMPDGQSLLYNSKGKLYRVAVTNGEPQALDTGFAVKCNNDHGISPDGKQLAISDQTRGGGKSLIYIVPMTGGEPRQVTEAGPSYWHGWSPDGETLAFCGERNKEFDIYTIPASGGPERRLTHSPGLDDGPDYSPDGKYIYFNSERTGLMQIWRMNADGTEQTQITKDDNNNWFAHPSPDGKWLVFLTFDKEVKGHPAEKEVQLRLMNLQTGDIQPLAKLFGGQGTINVPSWSPDSKRVAFVSYHYGISK